MLARDLGQFASSLRYEQLPADVVEMAKLRVLDLIASAMAGHRLGTWQALQPLVADQGPCTLWGSGAATSLRDAVLVNSFMSHAAYLEDGSRFVGGHPASAVIPGVLALAQSGKASGQDVITAIVAGYELFLRIGRCVYPSAVKRGFQTSAILAPMSLAGACASLMRLDAEAAQNALAISCNLGGGFKEAVKSPALQPLQVAHGAHGGIVAAQLAGRGGAGAGGIIENAFVPGYTDGSSTQGALEGLGSQFRIAETYIKVHGGCRGNHAPTDVTLGLVRQHGIHADQIESARLHVDSVTHAADIHVPTSGEQAQFCTAFSVAVSLLDGHASIFQFTDDKVADPRVRGLMQRITVVVDPVLDAAYPDKRGAALHLVLKDGRSFSATIDNALGEPESPFTAADIEAKFAVLTRDILGQRSQQLHDMVMRLEQLPHLHELVGALRATS